MTQALTRTHLTPAVLTAATGVLLGPLDEAFAVIHDLLGGPMIPAEVARTQSRLRAELIRQVPWLAEIRVPEFHQLPEPRFSKQRWLVEVISRYGGCVELQIGTLADRPAQSTVLPSYLTIGRTR